MDLVAGIFDKEEEAYRSIDAVNFSTISKIEKSPKHYKYFLENETPTVPAMEKGSALHLRMSNRDKFNSDYLIAPDIDRRTTDGKKTYAQFVAQSAFKRIISSKDYNDVTYMAEAIESNIVAMELLSGGVAEHSMFWKDPIYDLWLKGKCDYIKDQSIIIDIKTTENASRNNFLESVKKYNYALQASFYISGLFEITKKQNISFIWIAVESKPPWGVAIWKASEQMIKNGNLSMRYCLNKLVECQEKNEWHDITDGIEEI